MKSNKHNPLEDVLNLPSTALQRKHSPKKLSRSNSTTKGLKKELQDCLSKLETGEFIKKLKESSYVYTKKRIANFFDDHATVILKEVPRIRKLLIALEQTTDAQHINKEYKEILTKFCPPLFELIKKDDLYNLKAELRSLKEDMNPILEQLKDRTKELCAYIASDPLMSFKENNIKHRETVVEVLKEVNEELRRGIEGVRLMLKTRKEMHEKLVSQFMIRSNVHSSSESVKEITKLTSQLKEARSCASNYKSRIEELEKENGELNNELRQARDELQVLENANKASEQMIKDLKEQHEVDTRKYIEQCNKCNVVYNETIKTESKHMNYIESPLPQRKESPMVLEEECSELNKDEIEDIKKEEQQMTSRFGGMSDRFTENDTTIIIPKKKELLNKTVGDIANEFNNNKQKLKDSIKEMKERIERITGRRKNSSMNTKRLSHNNSLSYFK